MKTETPYPPNPPAAVRLVLGLGLLLAFVGCASVEHKLIPTAAADEADKGFRYYATAPYLLVHADGKGGIVWKIFHLPDQTRKMSASPENFLAKISTTMSFTDGVLTESLSEGDGTVVPKAIISAVEKFLPSLLAGNKTEGGHKIPPPFLYRIIVRQGTISFVGGQAAGEIQTTIRPGGKS